MAEMESRTERKKREAREKILAMSEELFVVEKSYKKVTMRKIAEKADVSVGTLYLHFKTKEDILATLFCHYINEKLEETSAILSGNEKGAEKINLLFDHLDKLSKNPRFNLYVQISLLDSSESCFIEKRISNDINLAMKKITSLFADVIRQGKEDRSIVTDIDTEILAVTIFNLIIPLLQSLAYKNSIFLSTLNYSERVNPNSIFSVLKTIISNGISISA